MIHSAHGCSGSRQATLILSYLYRRIIVMYLLIYTEKNHHGITNIRLPRNKSAFGWGGTARESTRWKDSTKLLVRLGWPYTDSTSGPTAPSQNRRRYRRKAGKPSTAAAARSTATIPASTSRAGKKGKAIAIFTAASSRSSSLKARTIPSDWTLRQIAWWPGKNRKKKKTIKINSDELRVILGIKFH